ncbi:acetamidase/formamidase family protein [Amycolatopsis sp.]|uniref:acetamidase/formamidase family protein n=1 Tax=Amycolatopsis sp. TaxID=37632 RepID=UPI002BAA5B21|nr:acetamidase/formamidase family protein [Amycolatopsis sp.]HVV14700.1 acetamidase/formamidase family protein [Amycolatopsis sp.]
MIRLDPAPDSTVDVFSRETPAALTVDPGATIVVSSLDAHGFLRRQREPGEQPPRMFAEGRGHCLTGPVGIRGAGPGDVLAVRFRSLVPGEWGWTVAAARDTWLNRRLGVADGPPTWLLWELGAGQATSNLGHTVRTAPFLGVVGMPPTETGAHATIPPRAAGGGNLDCRELVAGSTLYLPVTVPGAWLSLGDGHAAQGDGEVAGTAIECPMTTEVTLDVQKTAAIPGIHAETPAGRVTFGFSPELNEATADALGAMVSWLQILYDLDRRAALALASPVVHLRVTQVANGTWGVHALLPHDAIGSGG